MFRQYDLAISLANVNKPHTHSREKLSNFQPHQDTQAQTRFSITHTRESVCVYIKRTVGNLE